MDGKLNGNCTHDQMCPSGQYCSSLNYTCMPQKPLNSSCSLSNECQGSYVCYAYVCTTKERQNEVAEGFLVMGLIFGLFIALCVLACALAGSCTRKKTQTTTMIPPTYQQPSVPPLNYQHPSAPPHSCQHTSAPPQNYQQPSVTYFNQVPSPVYMVNDAPPPYSPSQP